MLANLCEVHLVTHLSLSFELISVFKKIFWSLNQRIKVTNLSQKRSFIKSYFCTLCSGWIKFLRLTSIFLFIQNIVSITTDFYYYVSKVWRYGFLIKSWGPWNKVLNEVDLHRPLISWSNKKTKSWTLKRKTLIGFD